MQEERQFPGAAYWNGFVYAIGGYTSTDTTSTVERFQVNGGTSWEFVQPMSVSRYKLGATQVNGLIYAVGGYIEETSCGATDVMEVYNPVTNKWQFATPLPTPVDLAGVTSIGDLIYVIGGENCTSTLSTLFIFNVTSQIWTTGPSLPFTVYKLAATPGPDGTVLALGGYAGNQTILNSMYGYDPSSNKWMDASITLPVPMYNFAATVQQDILYIMGGVTKTHTQKTFYGISYSTSIWQTGPTLPTVEKKFAAVSTGAQLVTVGEGAEAYMFTFS